ncbi:hypothetical protein [Arthrobacter sp. NA-172]|uniref:hypothetical protein n=1 Tax=Arthrobacter sp. NA-172 TaxID=3367524 RepID=UPI0037552A6E
MTSQLRVLDTASDWLYSALADPDGDVVLTSPYLSYVVCRSIADAAIGSSRSWTLYTTLDPLAVASTFLSVPGMALMLDTGVEVRHVDRLHAKCFIVGSRGMLGSANLTGAGLGSSVNSNRELGVELDRDQIDEARRMILAWPSRSVSRSDLDDLAVHAKWLPKPSPVVRDQDEDSTLLDVDRLLADAREPERSLWVKVEDGAPVLDQWRQEWRFANPGSKRGDKWIGEPSIKTGDLVFICATGTKDCYVVVEVTTDPELLPDDYVEWAAYREGEDPERWPWVNRNRPRLIPASLIDFKYEDLRGGKKLPRGSRFLLSPEEFVAGVRVLAQLPTE